MGKLRTAAWVVSMVGACGSDTPPGASLGLDRTLPDSPLARLPNASLQRAGDAFTLAGYDAAAATVWWARLGLDGTVTQEASFALAPPVVGPVLAATGKGAPGDQLVALSVVPSTQVIDGYDLVAIVHTAGAAAPAEPIPLAALPAGTDPATIDLVAGAAPSGKLGFVAWGTRVPGIPVRYLALPADARAAPTPSTFLDDDNPANVPAWACLSVQSTPTAFGIGVVTASSSLGGASDFQVLTIPEMGNPSHMVYQLRAGVKNCAIVGSSAPEGRYHMAFTGIWNDTTAIDFATYYPPIDPTKDGNVTTHHPVMPEVFFGVPSNMPTPAWVTSPGTDVLIGLTRKAGPQVVRYRYDAVKHGAALHLRTADGDAGPVSAWVGPDAAVYVTYTDRVKEGETRVTKRYFMRIDSPAALP